MRPFALRLVELRLHRGNRQPVALLEERQRKAFDEPQRIQHEFERQFSNRHRFLDGEGVRAVHVFARLLDALCRVTRSGKLTLPCAPAPMPR